MFSAVARAGSGARSVPAASVALFGARMGTALLSRRGAGTSASALSITLARTRPRSTTKGKWPMLH